MSEVSFSVLVCPHILYHQHLYRDVYFSWPLSYCTLLHSLPVLFSRATVCFLQVATLGRGGTMPARCSWDGPGLHHLIEFYYTLVELINPFIQKKIIWVGKETPGLFYEAEQLCSEGPAKEHSSPVRGSADE